MSEGWRTKREREVERRLITALTELDLDLDLDLDQLPGSFSGFLRLLSWVFFLLGAAPPPPLPPPPPPVSRIQFWVLRVDPFPLHVLLCVYISNRGVVMISEL